MSRNHARPFSVILPCGASGIAFGSFSAAAAEARRCAVSREGRGIPSGMAVKDRRTGEIVPIGPDTDLLPLMEAHQ